MQRRDMLERIAAVGTVGAVAGCLGGDGDGPQANDGSGLTVQSEPSIRTVNADCQSSDAESTSDWEDDGNGKMTFNGTILTSDPCREATIQNWSADEDSDTITIDVAAQSNGKEVCRQCTGQVTYQGTVEYSGGDDPSMTINHVEANESSGSNSDSNTTI